METNPKRMYNFRLKIDVLPVTNRNTVKPRYNGLHGTNIYHLLIADFCYWWISIIAGFITNIFHLLITDFYYWWISIIAGFVTAGLNCSIRHNI